MEVEWIVGGEEAGDGGSGGRVGVRDGWLGTAVAVKCRRVWEIAFSSVEGEVVDDWMRAAWGSLAVVLLSGVRGAVVRWPCSWSGISVEGWDGEAS